MDASDEWREAEFSCGGLGPRYGVSAHLTQEGEEVSEK